MATTRRVPELAGALSAAFWVSAWAGEGGGWFCIRNGIVSLGLEGGIVFGVGDWWVSG
jgi:hypothetical protein